MSGEGEYACLHMLRSTRVVDEVEEDPADLESLSSGDEGVPGVSELPDDGGALEGGEELERGEPLEAAIDGVIEGDMSERVSEALEVSPRAAMVPLVLAPEEDRRLSPPSLSGRPQKRSRMSTPDGQV